MIIFMFQIGDNKMELETCYVNRNNFEILIKDLLLVKQYRVEVWRRNSKTLEWLIINSVCTFNFIIMITIHFFLNQRVPLATCLNLKKSYMEVKTSLIQYVILV